MIFSRWFSQSNSVNWIDHLNDLVNSYNNRRNRSIGMAPNKVTKEVKQKIISKAEKINEQALKQYESIQVGDYVRILNPKTIFTKTSQIWSEDVYRVEQKAGYSYLLYNVDTENQSKRKFKFYQIQKIQYQPNEEKSSVKETLKELRQVKTRERRRNKEDIEIKGLENPTDRIIIW